MLWSSFLFQVREEFQNSNLKETEKLLAEKEAHRECLITASDSVGIMFIFLYLKRFCGECKCTSKFRKIWWMGRKQSIHKKI